MSSVDLSISPNINSITFEPILKPFTKQIPASIKGHNFLPIQIQENSRWERIKNIFQTKSSLHQRIEMLSQSKDFSVDWKQNLSHIKSAFNSNEYPLLSPHLKHILQKLTTEELKQLFRFLINHALKNSDSKIIQNCLQIFSIEELEQIFHEHIKATGLPTDKAMQLAILAKNEHNKIVKSTALPVSQQQRSSIAKFFHTLIMTVLMSIRIFEIGREPHSHWDASQQLDSYAKIIGIPLIIFTALATFLAPLTAVIITAAAVSTLALACFLYARHWKRPSEYVEPCVNLAIPASKGVLPPVIGRETEVDAALHCLAASSPNFRSHPCFVGPSGVGKSLLFNRIAQRIVTGNVPDRLKGKIPIYINVAKLIGNSSMHDGRSRLQRLLDTLKPNKDKYIIMLDEIQNAIKTPELGEPLKSAFDTTVDSLPYIATATTREDYDKYMASDITYSRRGQKIDIYPTNEKQTLLILKEMVSQEAPDEGITDENLETIYKASSTGKLFQPTASMFLLSKTINHFREGQFVPKELIDKEQELLNLYASISRDPECLMDPKIISQIEKLQTEIKEIKTDQTPEKKLLEKWRLLRRQRNEHIKFLYEKICSEDPQISPSATMENKKTFLFYQHFLLPHLKQKIERFQKKFPKKMITKIDNDLIEKLAKEQEKV